MGRKPNPRGKDRSRTIQLDGDVSDIAQALADKSQLSAQLSQLLRQHYNISDELSTLKTTLASITDQRKAMQAQEDELIEEIERAELELQERVLTHLPALEARRSKLKDRYERLSQELARAFDPQTRALKETQLMNTLAAIKETDQELQGLKA